MLEQEQVDVAVSRRAECGEGPLWDAEAGAVHWVDIIGGEILTTDFASGATAVITHPTMVGAAAPRAEGGFVAAVTTGFVGIASDGEITHRVDCLGDGIRMNDAKTDPNGVYWSGSCASDFAEGAGALWRLDGDWQAILVLPGLTQPNGMGWSPAGDLFYLVETQARQLLSFPFDLTTSTLDPTPTVLIDSDGFPEGLPDGLAVDTAGNIWIAMFAGSAVHEFTPGGRLVRSIGIPTKQTTSCMFVGPDRDELWVTSAAWQISEDEDPGAGSVFRVRDLGATGLPTPPFRG
jgi:sugar lactone lactonase YvrE